MKNKVLFIILFLISSLTFAQPRLEEYILDNFSGGLNIQDIPIKINKAECSDCQNVLFDDNISLSKRLGYELFCNLPVSGKVYLIDEFKRQSSEIWLMIHISTSVYASKDDGVTWIKVIEGLKEINPGNAVTYDDEWWFTNGTDDIFSWNGSTVSSYSFIPQGKYIEVHNNQLFIANVPENYSAIFWCNNINAAKSIVGWDYYNCYIIGENDGDPITGIRSERNLLLITKTNSMWYLNGDGLTYDVPAKYTDVYGCVSYKTLNKYMLSPLFLSKRGLCYYGGGDIRQIDRQIEDLTLNARVSVGSVVGKYWGQTTENDFALGSSSNVIVKNGVIKLMSSDTYIGDNKSPLWIEYYYTGNPLLQTSDIVNYSLTEDYTVSQGGIANTTYDLATGFYNWITLPQNDSVKNWSITNVSINVKRPNNDIYKSSVTLTLYDIIGTTKATETKFISDLANGDWYIFFATYSIVMPRTFRVGLTRKEGGNNDTGISYLTYIEKGMPYDFATEWSSFANYGTNVTTWNGNGWEIVESKVVNINSVNMYDVLLRKKRTGNEFKKLAVRYQYNMTPSTWGYLTSQKFDAGTNINTWKHFITADTGSGITYQIKYATGSTALDSASWVSISNGGLIAATTSQYWIQWKTTLNNTAQEIESILLRWFEGNSSDYEECTSLFYKNRYHLGFSTYSYTNHIIIVFDRNGRFTKFNIPAECFGTYDNDFLFAKSNKLYKMYSTRNDNGAAIDAYWESKDLDFGNPEVDKIIEKISVTHKGSGTLEMGIKPNYNTSFTTFSITMGSSIDNDVCNVPKLSPAKYWRIKIRNNGISEWFEVPEVRIYFKTMPLIVR